jgi:hypothetical protein
VSIQYDNNIGSLLLLDRAKLKIDTLRLACCDPFAESVFLCLGLFPSLTRLIIKECDFLASVSFLRFLALNPQLKSLHISKVKPLPAEVISGITRNCPNLTALNFSMNEWFGDDSLSLLTHGNLSKIEEIEISYTSVRERDSFVNIFQAFPRLKDITVIGCELSADAAICIIDQLALHRLRSSDRSDQRHGSWQICPML